MIMKYALLTLVLLSSIAAVAVAQDAAETQTPPAADPLRVEPPTPPPGIQPAERVSLLPPEDRAMVAAWVAAAVAFITGISVLGAAYAVAHIGSAAIGAASEKPEMMGRSLVFVALGEGLAVLGLAVAFVLMFTVLNNLI
jgi:F0F1-type ATP synthase membrane subunit c/vacuolar-type H+-ATPase subunit K